MCGFEVRSVRLGVFLHAIGCILEAIAWKNYRVCNKAPSEGVGNHAKNYVPIKIISPTFAEDLRDERS